jgi:hypothetical protein
MFSPLSKKLEKCGEVMSIEGWAWLDGVMPFFQFKLPSPCPVFLPIKVFP